MAQIKPLRYSSAKSFISKKYNKGMWTNANTDNIGTYDVLNSLFDHLESATLKCSSGLLRLWRAIVRDVDGGGTATWDLNQYQHLGFKPKLIDGKFDFIFSNYYNNGFSLIHDTNSSIYFGATNHWLLPNNGMKVWLILDQNRLDLFNTNANLQDKESYSRLSWYMPKRSLDTGGYSGMRYNQQRPYGFNMFVDYSTSARGPSSQDQPFTHEVLKVNDIYKKVNRISKFKLKDGVILSTLRIFKSLRRTNTARLDRSNISSTALDFQQIMNPPKLTNILICFVAKATNTMVINLKVLLFDLYYHRQRNLLWDTSSTSNNNIYTNYHQAFAAHGKLSPLPSSSGGAISSTGIRSALLNLNVSTDWKLFWVIAPFKRSGVQRGINDILFHAGRLFVNLDKVKISLSVPRGSRNRLFHIDFLDAIVSLEILYSTLTLRPITVTSTLFNGTSQAMGGDSSRSFGYGTISQSNLIKRNSPPYFFKVKPDSSKLLINYDGRQPGQVTLLSTILDQRRILLNNFRNSKFIYEVF